MLQCRFFINWKDALFKMDKKNTGAWTNQLGFVLAAAGSAVGVGNIWRFPYLVAKDGGGLFLLVYLVLVLTFGYALLVSDLALGRGTQSNSIRAYKKADKKWNFLGKVTCIVPALIMTYYAIIGGWILKYIVVYFTGNSTLASADGYFTNFITSVYSPIIFALIFMCITAWVVYLGIDKGIEKVSKIVMPILLLMIIVIAIFALTLKHTDSNGIVRTGLQGFLIYITPNFDGLTLGKFLQIVLDAMSQLFFSLSVAMGIMITYGSYVPKNVNMNKSVQQIELFDTVVAFLAGMMIIPTVFAFSGTEGMSVGPGLVFISLPKIFNEMGSIGIFIGIIFFIMFAFAALTSCISVLETLVANAMEFFNLKRKNATLWLAVIYSIATVVVCLGYNVFYFELKLPNGSTAQLLDLMDYISNSFLMPLICMISCVFIGWVLKPEWIIKEMESSGDKMTRKRLYAVMIKYIAPVVMFILFLQSAGIFNLIFK